MSMEQLVFLIQRIREREPQHQPTLAESRASLAEMERVFPLEEDIACSPVAAESAPGEWILAPQADPTRVLLYLHGGGYALGSPASHRALVGRLSRAGQARALSLDYRLAPEHPHPAALEDALAAYRWLLHQPVAPERIVIGGDSAGGGLALATLVALRDRGDPLPAGAVCLSPWTDLAMTGDSIRGKAGEDPMLQPDDAERYVNYYTAGADPTHPLISPLYADLAGLPPLLIQVGTAEILLDDSARLAGRAREAGVTVSYEPWERMIHVWQFFAPLLEEGRQAIERIGGFIRERVP